MPHATIDGRRWFYDFHGDEGAPLVVLANGVLAEARGWRPQVDVLKANYRVLTFDFLGQGRSDPLDEPVTIADQTAGAAKLIDELQVGPVHWIGVSYGGEVGLQLAVDDPHCLQSLIVADSVAVVDTYLACRGEAWLAAARTGDADLLYRVCASDIFSAGYMAAHSDAMTAVRKGFHALDLQSVVNLLEGYSAYDVSGDLVDIDVPTMALCGELDLIKSPSAMQVLADRIPNAAFLTVPGAGHALHIERPAEFMTACLGFLAQQGAS